MKNFPFLVLLKGNKFQTNEKLEKSDVKIKNYTLKKLVKNKDDDAYKTDLEKSLIFLITLLSKIQILEKNNNPSHNPINPHHNNNKPISIIHKLLSEQNIHVSNSELHDLIPDLTNSINHPDNKKILSIIHKLLSEMNTHISNKSSNPSHNPINPHHNNNKPISIIHKLLSEQNIHVSNSELHDLKTKENFKDNLDLKKGIVNLVKSDQSNKSNRQSNYKNHEKMKSIFFFVKRISIEKKENIKKFIFHNSIEKNNIKKNNSIKLKEISNNNFIFNTNFDTNTEITTEKNEQNLLDQVKKTFLKVLKNNIQKITVKLHPPELGRLVVIIKLQKNRIHTSIHTENHKVTNFIKENIGNIEEALNNLGYKIHKIDVKTAFSFEKQFLSQDNQEFSSRKEKKENEEKRRIERLYKILSLNKSDEELAQIMLINKTKEKNSSSRGLDIII